MIRKNKRERPQVAAQSNIEAFKLASLPGQSGATWLRGARPHPGAQEEFMSEPPRDWILGR